MSDIEDDDPDYLSELFEKEWDDIIRNVIRMEKIQKIQKIYDNLGK